MPGNLGDTWLLHNLLMAVQGTQQESIQTHHVRSSQLNTPECHSVVAASGLGAARFGAEVATTLSTQVPVPASASAQCLQHMGPPAYWHNHHPLQQAHAQVLH